MIGQAARVPEGHTIRRAAAEHARRFGGHVVAASSPQGRFADGAARIDGRVLETTDAYGKHMLLDFGADVLLHVHLGLYGHWTFGALPPPAPRGALRLRLVGGESYADLRGAPACELWTPGDVDALFARLGPDPLRGDADPDRAWARISRSRAAIGQLLMDQSAVAGIGNVFRAELLFRARMSPFRAGRLVTRPQWDALWSDIVTSMRAGLRSGRIVTTRPEDRERPRGRVRSVDAHYVYRRAGLPCRVCGTTIRTEPMADRNLFWCPRCQRR
jgi:formamidopyrimidine-DNA glycosylase